MQEEALEGEEVGRVGRVVVVVEGEGLGGVCWRGVGLALGRWRRQGGMGGTFEEFHGEGGRLRWWMMRMLGLQ